MSAEQQRAPDANEVPEFTISRSPSLEQAFRRPDRAGLRNVRWFWRRRIVASQLNILAGVQGVGKSQFVLALAAEASQRAENVLVLSAEDLDEETVWPRLVAAGADLDHVRTLRADFELWLPEDFGLLQRFIEQSEAQLVILDPIIAFVDGKTDSWKDHDVRRVLRVIRGIAHTTGATIVGLMHPKKGEEAEVVNIISGSVAWTAAPRSTLIVTRAQDSVGLHDPRRVLFHVKCNVGREQLPLEFEIEDMLLDNNIETSRVKLGEENADLDVREHVGKKRVKPAAPERERAEQFLEKFLAAGERPQTEVLAAAAAELISERTLRRAKESLGVTSHGREGVWYWLLPSLEEVLF